MGSTVVVAMDGPSGSGKSSTSRAVAHRLGLRYLDTGAQFRALTAAVLDAGADLEDPDAIAAAAATTRVESGTDPQHPTITVDGVDVAARIRTQEVTDHVSAVASVPQVRQRLLDLQRAIIGDGGIVVEGRDIGSVVAPDAEVKLYLTADPAARAQRRTAENGAADVDATRADLLRRDSIDSGRATAPAVAPDGAVHLDTTPYTLDEVVEQVIALVRQQTDQHTDQAAGRATGAGSAP
ncbi:(d)CMP kinase [Nocardioides aurantiacus]|uniref:Cytidylate kinase n=1 Tax=Nocardioides aurantiacus TaxID=86796 RepID=A0A3N2CUF8_9ACTN|nr:(d)CMP kinase [Nocardioides aurantiacus]ROR91167.1 cytidylate kinase [Nocardioides aurantiacus]